MATMKQILFVDDEPLVLQALQRSLNRMREQWNMQFVGSADEALKFMAEHPADVVVSDMRMPGMNGAELLNELMQKHPTTARIILSGYADSAMTMQCAGATHQFLLKPCEARTLSSAIQRALDTSHWMKSARVCALVARMSKLPGLPPIYFQILKEMQSPTATLGNVGKIISREPQMAQKFLALINSGAFGFGRPVTDPTEAVLQLGTEISKSLVLAAHIYSEFNSGEGSKAMVDRICQHSVATAIGARRIAQSEGKEERFAQESFTAGLFHNIGCLALATKLPDDYAEVLTCSQMQSLPLVDSEQSNLGVNHAEVGGYLLGLWGLPVGVAEAAMFHHTPLQCPNKEFAPLTAVHISGAVQARTVAGLAPALLAQLDEQYLANTGILPRLPQIRKALEKILPA
jgi:HD-like signal output (HDOD) protein/CheY-like chemotaxis protein